MEPTLFHIFRNTPVGRETLFQSTYFCRKVGASLTIFIPRSTKFLMYFENDVVQVDLDESYLISPETARQHAGEVTELLGITPSFFEPKNFTATTLPDVPTRYDFMCCPRSVSDLSSKIGLGYIGPRVRRIVKSAHFPVLLTSPVFKEWKSITAFFGGSANGVKALRLACRMARRTGMNLNIFTIGEGKSKADYEKIIETKDLDKDFETYVSNWVFTENDKLEECLYDIPHDAILVLGAYGHGIIRDIMFGSKMEKIQSILPNNMLIVGPNYAASTWRFE